jgi:protease-4
MLRSVDKVYDTFTSRVSNGRNLPKEKVLELAQGRVWSGTRAVELGLADANGGLSAAIAVAVDKAGIADNYRVTEVLEDLSPVAQFMQALNMNVKAYLYDAETLEAVEYYNALKREVSREGVQAFCPYAVGIN